MFYRGCIAVAAISIMPLVSAFAAESGINVIMNQAKIVKLSRAADTIIVGNPEIADASIQDAKTIVLTGKGFGTTNFVVIDAEGNAIVDEMVMVSRGDANTMRIYRGTDIQTLSCTPNCENAYKTAAEKSVGEQTGAAN
jgi:Flp pilus assembly secretin CpaC